MAEVHFHVIILPIFNQTKYHPHVQEHMASAFDNMEKDLLFFEQKVWFALVEVSTHSRYSNLFSAALIHNYRTGRKT